MVREMTCEVCGKLETDIFFTDSQEEDFIVPVQFCKTIQQYGKFYKEYFGETFEEMTGEKLSQEAEQVELPLTHLDICEYDGEERDRHSLGNVLCWHLII